MYHPSENCSEISELGCHLSCILDFCRRLKNSPRGLCLVPGKKKDVAVVHPPPITLIQKTCTSCFSVHLSTAPGVVELGCAVILNNREKLTSAYFLVAIFSVEGLGFFNC